MKYMECDAKTRVGVLEVFECATMAALINRKQKKKKQRVGETSLMRKFFGS